MCIRDSPNTAYAKLATGIPSLELARQGGLYLLNSLRWDPLTLAVIVAAVLWAVAARRVAAIAVALGIVLYLLYVVRIGGDFMSGRFLTLPLLAAVGLLLAGPGRTIATATVSSRRRAAAITAALILLLAAIDVYKRQPMGPSSRACAAATSTCWPTAIPSWNWATGCASSPCAPTCPA